MAVPYTGIILSTRETVQMRTALLELGVSQMSAGSCTEPGGYANTEASVAQFSVGDSRSLDEVIADIAQHGYVPSFCTGCYRKGRTGADFMELARPGLIRAHCLPNALLTYREYLLDYGSERTRELGERVIREQLEHDVPDRRKRAVLEALDRIDQGERDIYF
jgi:2-iminoacetate synthase